MRELTRLLITFPGCVRDLPVVFPSRPTGCAVGYARVRTAQQIEQLKLYQFYFIVLFF